MEKHVFNVNEGSIIDLKAELSRKEESTRKRPATSLQPSQNNKTLAKLNVITGKWKSLYAKEQNESAHLPTSNKKQVEAEQLDLQLSKSRLQLEAKSKIYDNMQSGTLEDDEQSDGETKYLVDFQKKSIANDKARTYATRDEWVEFTDSYGRARKCQRKDLDHFQDMDPDLVVSGDRWNPMDSMAQAEAKHLVDMHDKWDREEEVLRENIEGPVHYESVKFDEVRQLGVGYYQFSKNEESRQEQMQLLGNLRKETVDQRSRQNRLKERRKELMKERLEKIKKRKAARTEQPEDEAQREDEAHPDDAAILTGEDCGAGRSGLLDAVCNKELISPCPVAVPAASTANDPERPTLIGQRGTQGSLGPESYAEKRRNERLSEFAPPVSFEGSGKTMVDVQRKRSHNMLNDIGARSAQAEQDDGVADQIDSFLSQCRS